MRKNIFLGANWKMNRAPAAALLAGSQYRSTSPEVVVFPMLTDIGAALSAGLTCGAQCGHGEVCGAFTGNVPMQSLKDLGCSYVLCGHSERRQYQKESDEDIARQVHAAWKARLIPILCIGETDAEKTEGKTNDVLRRQLSALLGEDKASMTSKNIIIAYEPVWAIGTGKTPHPSDADRTHAFIRSLLPDPAIRILYGGSMNGANAESFLAEANIDGGLIGGASLKPEEFQMIVEAAKNVQ